MIHNTIVVQTFNNPINFFKSVDISNAAYVTSAVYKIYAVKLVGVVIG